MKLTIKDPHEQQKTTLGGLKSGSFFRFKNSHSWYSASLCVLIRIDTALVVYAVQGGRLCNAWDVDISEHTTEVEILEVEEIIVRRVN